MKNIIFSLVVALMLVSCMAYADPPIPPSDPAYGCVVVEDDYGEREVCDVQYYISPEGPLYLDSYFGVWIGAGGFWYGGVWHYGYYPGYWERYHGFYHEHGFYNGHGFRGYYGHHYGGGGFRGGYHGGGGHFGGGHGHR